jgi:hypothetical protein
MWMAGLWLSNKRQKNIKSFLQIGYMDGWIVVFKQALKNIKVFLQIGYVDGWIVWLSSITYDFLP